MLPRSKDIEKASPSAAKEITSVISFFTNKMGAFILIITIALSIFFLNSNSSLVYLLRQLSMNYTSYVYQKISVPMSYVESAVFNVKQAFNAHNTIPKLIKEKEELLEKLSYYKNIEKENNQLQQLLKVSNHSLYSFVSAKVVSENFRGAESRFLINAGSSIGIKEGMAVINQYGLIGRVIDVAEHSARVLTLQDEQSSIPVKIANVTIGAILKGGQNQLKIEYTKLDKVKSGMDVYTSGEGSLMPKGIYIGKVSEDKRFVDMAVRITNLSYVSIIKGNIKTKNK